MTIRTGINPEAVLWKYTETVRRRQYNYETNQHAYVDVVQYYVIRLHTRRARSMGHTIDKTIYPFFQSIRINLIPRRVWMDHGSEVWHTAVGTRSDRVMTKELWDELEIDEAAQKWYSRLKNNNMVPLLDKRDGDFSIEIIEEMKAIAQDDSSEVESWPPEPNIPQHNMQIDGYYYYHPINWR